MIENCTMTTLKSGDIVATQNKCNVLNEKILIYNNAITRFNIDNHDINLLDLENEIMDYVGLLKNDLVYLENKYKKEV